MSNASNTMILVGGSKGGVGKSLVTMAVVDWLCCAMNESTLLIDGDESNPDVYKAYENVLEPKPITINLDVREGWLSLADRCAGHPSAHVVINTGARNIDAMLRYSGSTMNGVATELQRSVVVLWVINAERDGVELLRRYVDAIRAAHTTTQLHVVCNEGEEEGRSFNYYKGTETAKVVSDMGWRTIVIPTLAKRATTLLYTKRKTIRVVAGDDPNELMPFGTRLEMTRWRNVVRTSLESLRLTEQ